MNTLQIGHGRATRPRVVATQLALIVELTVRTSSQPESFPLKEGSRVFFFSELALLFFFLSSPISVCSEANGHHHHRSCCTLHYHE